MQMEDVYRIDQGIDRYMTKTQKKTADFMEGCMELGGLLGGWSSDEIMYLKRYGHALGMAFQITDDIMDYRETSDTTGKPLMKAIRISCCKILRTLIMAVMNKRLSIMLLLRVV